MEICENPRHPGLIERFSSSLKRFQVPLCAFPLLLHGAPQTGSMPATENQPMAATQPIARPSGVETTRELILDLFASQDHNNSSLRELADRAEAFTRAGTRHARLDGLVNLFAWVRARDLSLPLPKDDASSRLANSDPEWRRELVWLSILRSSGEIRDRYLAGIAAILDETDGVSLFAESGMPSDRGLLPEAIDRLFTILLPAPREETELAKLFLRLFPTQREVERFFSLPAEQLQAAVALLAPVDIPEAWEKPVASLLDAFCLLGARVQGLGLSEKLRVRSGPCPVQESPFYRLGRAGDALVDAIRAKQGTAAAAQAWKSVVADCRAEMSRIVAHLDARGVNLDIVYALDVIEKSLARMELISGTLLAQPGPPKILTGLRLTKDVIRGRINDRSLWNLAHNSFRLLARKIVEWAGKTGEHYISSNREEYRQMWKAAIGGGLLTVGTAAIKLMVTHRGLPPFVEGFLAGLNYAVSFVLMQNFHLALATKQPSMTGATLARIIQNCQGTSKVDELINYVQRIVRTQLAAALGNILAVGAGAVVFSILWKLAVGEPFLSAETADYAVKSLNPLRSGTIFYAMLTGVILWLSSLAGGWIENWAVYHQLPRAIAEHRLGSVFKPETLLRVSENFSKNIAGWGGSIVLGFMLGMTPSFGHFFGLPLDVRHVTLSTGTVALGIASRGPEVLGRGALIMAALGIACTFLLNLGVSFYLALRLALRAQDVSPSDHLQILRNLWNAMRTRPRDFFFPPAQDAGPSAAPAH
jgi:site-specific recombinase